MKHFKFIYKKTSGIDSSDLKKEAEKSSINKVVQAVKNALHLPYQNKYASVHLPFDTVALERIKHLAKEKKQLNPSILVVVGIGGSNMGAKAVQEAVLGRYYNASNPILKIYFADTVDTDRMTEIIRVVEEALSRGQTVLINVITKSGTTMETIINFQTLLAVVQQYHKNDYQKFIVVTTDKQSKLWGVAQQAKFDILEIPEKVGGRYSVFSAVGLFPLALCGISVDDLLKGAQQGALDCVQEEVSQNPALISALLLTLYYQKNISIHDLFLFGVDLQSLGQWYRQLTGESLGKEHNLKGERVFTGITPTVSVGSVDLHSVAQLYLGGPRDKFTTFVTVEQNNNRLIIPHLSLFDKAFPGLAGKTFESVMDALSEGTQTAYLKNKRPYCSVILSKKDAYSVGQFMQFKMIEMIYLGHLLQVDPFDQPNVELYKKETRRLLGY